MDKFNARIDKVIDELAHMAQTNANIYEYLTEVYGETAVEENFEGVIIDFIAVYYNVIDDIIERNA